MPESMDKHLKCTDCGTDFVFSAAQQLDFERKGLFHEPKLCHNCGVKNRLKRKGSTFEGTEVNCGNCGVLTRVPFKPKGRSPVLCPSCLHQPKQ
jgi:CxxC-x17-CxxC domain-containing protein